MTSILNVFRFLPKSPLLLLAGLFTASTVTVGTFASFGPERTPKVWSENVSAFDHPVFNSFTNIPGWGDERDFTRGVVVGRDGDWIDPINNVEAGQTVRVMVYIHNGADPALNASGKGIAKDAKLAVNIPTDTSKTHEIKSTLSASNATTVWDTVSLNGQSAYSLDYVEGSATISGKNYSNKKVSDDIVNGGIKLGDALDGNLKGCFDYVQYVQFDVKIAKSDFEVSKKVRLEGQTNWVENVDVKEGDKVEWQIGFDNTGSTVLNDVVVLDELPEGLTAIADTISVDNAAYPNGHYFGSAALQANGKQVNVNIGSYTANSNAYVYFTTTVDSTEDCGVTEFTNNAWVTPSGEETKWDKASVTLNKVCEEEEEYSYDCEALNVSFVDKAARKVNAKADISHSDNVTVKSVSIDFGDGTVVNKNDANHTYSKDGNYTVKATVEFNVGDEVKKDVCTDTVSFSTPEKEEEVTALPNTGIASSLTALLGVTSAATAGYGYLKSKRS